MHYIFISAQNAFFLFLKTVLYSGQVSPPPPIPCILVYFKLLITFWYTLESKQMGETWKIDMKGC